MATDLDYERLRQDIGANRLALTDNDADSIFIEAAEEYTGAASIKAQARVIAISRLLASSAKLNDYTQDTTTEKLSQVFDHLQEMLKQWQARLADAVSAETRANGGAARFGGRRTKPARVKEWPEERAQPYA